jgi:molybdopterin converting factor small subunit
VGTAQVILSMPDGATAAQVLDELRSRHARFEAGLQGEGLPKALATVPYALFLNARPLPFDRVAETPLRDGDRLYLFLPVAGG